MSKRYTDAEKWCKNWFTNLDNNTKLLWIFICDHCDHAGLLDVNYKLFTFLLGFPINKETINILGDKIIWLEEDKLFIPGFVDFQYGKLDENNRVHKSVLNKLDPYKTLIRPFKGYKDKDKDKYKDKEKEKSKFDFDFIWNKYPVKDGKKEALKHFNASVLSNDDYQAINKALDNYLVHTKGKELKYIKNGSTWFNNWRDWVDYKVVSHPISKIDLGDLINVD